MAVLSVTPASVIASASAIINRNFNAGATITAGQLVYLDTTTNTWKLVDDNAAVTGNEIATTKGIALAGASSGQPLAVCLRDTDFTPGATLSNGLAIYASSTAGGMTQAEIPTNGQYPTVVGIAKSTTKMNLNPTSSGAII